VAFTKFNPRAFLEAEKRTASAKADKLAEPGINFSKVSNFSGDQSANPDARLSNVSRFSEGRDQDPWGGAELSTLAPEPAPDVIRRAILTP
jgi:hypothetical protein